MNNSTPLAAIRNTRGSVHVGDGVRYIGSIEQAHGLYRVLAKAEDGRLTLGRKGHGVLKGVRPGSVMRESVCTTCDAAPRWLRATRVGDSPAFVNACIDCAEARFGRTE